MRLPVAEEIETRDGEANKDGRLTNTLAEADDFARYAVIRPGIKKITEFSGGGGGLVSFSDSILSVYGSSLASLETQVNLSVLSNALPAIPSLTATSSITAGNELVVVGYRLTSPWTGYVAYGDGVNWSPGSMPDGRWVSVAWNGEVYCAISIAQGSATSVDGSAWTLRTNLSTQSWRKVVSYDGKFYAISAYTTILAISEDNGVTWSETNLTSTFAFQSSIGMTVNEKGIMLTGLSDSTATAESWYSPDFGSTWIGGLLPSSSSYYDSVAYGNNTYIASAGALSSVAFSTNGVDWVSEYVGVNGGIVGFYEKYFYTIGTGPGSRTAVAYSTDGRSWVSKIISDTNTWSIAAGEGFGFPNIYAITGSTVDRDVLKTSIEPGFDTVVSLQTGYYDFAQSVL